MGLMKNKTSSPATDARTSLLESTRPYQQPDGRRATLQLLTSVAPYFALLASMWLLADISPWLALVLAVPAAGFFVRVYILFHDATHGSLFKSRRLNDAVGAVVGAITLTPFQAWRSSHARHHATSGDLDRRGRGDVWTLTVAEYAASPLWRRIVYRFYRNPVVLLILGTANVLILSRIGNRRSGPRDRRSIMLTNIGVAGVMAAGILLLGLPKYLLIQVSVYAIASAAGVWLFYVQHQYEGVYWARTARWDFINAAVEGSSYYKLPRLLQFFSGNIGFHHVHHLNPRVPNYHLERCHRGHPGFARVKALTLVESLKSLSLRLFDEDSGRLVRFRDVRRLAANPA
jgi:omega-6 fatty acid desaturase (delta-12 desaturase)